MNQIFLQKVIIKEKSYTTYFGLKTALLTSLENLSINKISDISYINHDATKWLDYSFDFILRLAIFSINQ